MNIKKFYHHSQANLKQNYVLLIFLNKLWNIFVSLPHDSNHNFFKTIKVHWFLSITQEKAATAFLSILRRITSPEEIQQTSAVSTGESENPSGPTAVRPFRTTHLLFHCLEDIQPVGELRTELHLLLSSTLQRPKAFMWAQLNCLMRSCLNLLI